MQIIATYCSPVGSNREIARELRLSEHTVKKYPFRIFDKVGISNRQDQPDSKVRSLVLGAR
jgi:ATP/maltotriose-dependent transcriptional regulator MalT